MSDSRRTGLLLAALAVVALIVALDFATGGATGGPGAEGDATPSESPYAAQTNLLARTEAVVESAGEWSAAADEARAAWDARRARAISAPSAEIAAARLRSIIEPLLADEGLRLTASETLPARDPGGEASVAVIGLSLSIEGTDAESVFRFIDRLEHLPDAAVAVDALALRGPGRLGGAPRLQATLRARAVAVVQSGGARG
jgi:hypothetical protein